MTLANNPNITEKALRDLHADLLQWAVFCNDFDHEAAKDVLQQSYLKIMDGRAVYDKKSTLKTWLYSVIRLSTFESRRQQAKGIQVSCEFEELEELHSQLPEHIAENLYPDKVIETAIRGLSLAQREIIYLAFYKELTLAEISQVLDVSIGTVRTQYHRAKVRLKVLLTEAEKGNFNSGVKRYEEQYS